MNRKTASCRRNDGRLIKRFVNCFRNVENICPMMLSIDFANVSEKSLWKNLLEMLRKSKFCNLTYVLNACSTIVGTKKNTGIAIMIVMPISKIIDGIFLPPVLDFIFRYIGLKMYANRSPNIIGTIIGLRTKNARMNTPTMIAATMPRFISL